MAELAEFDRDVGALGGVPVDVVAEAEEAERAQRLVQLASAEALAYLDGFGVTEAAIAGWDDVRKEALAALVAEVAARRMQVSAAPSVDPYTYGSPPGPQTIHLTKADQRRLLNLLPIDEDDEYDWWKP